MRNTASLLPLLWVDTAFLYLKSMKDSRAHRLRQLPDALDLIAVPCGQKMHLQRVKTGCISVNPRLCRETITQINYGVSVNDG
jgi:hypothetical protein